MVGLPQGRLRLIDLRPILVAGPHRTSRGQDPIGPRGLEGSETQPLHTQSQTQCPISLPLVPAPHARILEVFETLQIIPEIQNLLLVNLYESVQNRAAIAHLREVDELRPQLPQ